MNSKHLHELKDPVHSFVYYDEEERKVIDSQPLQRLRHIHQLSLAFSVYPGATHRRFEHSLGVMNLASRVYDIVTLDENVSDEIRELLPQLKSRRKLDYWKMVLRLAALCHDIGHLPFSHVPEEKLLPNGWKHEDMTRELILSREMRKVWNSLEPTVQPEHIAKLAVGQEHAKGLDEFSDWETILTEIITGDAFGVDRIDYLVRDAYHTGVAYGRIDYYRLIDTLRILRPPPVDAEGEPSREPSLGVDFGGLAAAEALLLARYYMFRTVYFHPVARIYGIHLRDFLLAHRKNEPFPTDYEGHLLLTDNEVMTNLLAAAKDKDKLGHDPARRIVERDHFKVLYERSETGTGRNPGVARDIFKAAAREFGDEAVRYDILPDKGKAPDFSVRLRDKTVASASAESRILKNIPTQKGEYVFIDPRIRDKGKKWLGDSLARIIENPGSDENGKS